MTPLMKFRLDTDCGVSSDILLSSIAGSPRRAGARPDGEGICPVDDNPVRVRIQRVRFCKQMSSLTFLGAAGTVTGSKHLLDLDGKLILVDCGLFQGLKELRQRNWEPFPVDPARLAAVVLTHAHLDHCGYLPRLVANGFRGRIFCTPATKELCSLVLPDSAHLQEEDAREANRYAYSRHSPALPLYTSIDAARTLTQLQPVGYDRPIPLIVGDGEGTQRGRRRDGAGTETSASPAGGPTQRPWSGDGEGTEEGRSGDGEGTEASASPTVEF